MPITNGNYSVPNNFVQQYNLGQKKIRADLVDENFTDVADVINDLIDDDELTVHTNDDQTISGDKTFTGDVTFTGGLDVSSVADSLFTQLRSDILASVFPVGSLYMTTSETNPATIFGFGTWLKIEGRMIIGASSSYSVTSTGGEATHKLTVNETPAHTHTRGTMDINGQIKGVSEAFNGNGTCTGAFTKTSGNPINGTPTAVDTNNCGIATFQASRNWTGATSSVGGNAAHNNMPPYYAAYIWRRTA